ncbi:SLATT domain-containing protein [Mesorhizobium sp. BR-1-1-10]|uniref:SLATT domain-containing protein n=1 Tax=Mesorhizobium sp. BR-1-1-10 TaxID=2876660 RepID=UPI001CD07BEA|nr:SLATT domain-containing protein [Mesorhizobium sp. BR-1-1-10]MBZ9977816.1 SLATT domain-containing protein [Mesorhizobium sp. BR-1-1-10]
MTEFSAMEDQIRECFGRVIYTHKTHEKMAEACATTLQRYKLCQIAVSVLTTSGALSVVFLDQFWLKLATAVLSIVGLWASGYMKGFDPGGTAQKHRDAAANLWPVRESYLSLLTDLRMGALSEKDAAQRRDELQATLAAIYSGSPQTTYSAYKKAQEGLQKNEEYTFSDQEIDKFVPASLRKSKKG